MTSCVVAVEQGQTKKIDQSKSCTPKGYSLSVDCVEVTSFAVLPSSTIIVTGAASLLLGNYGEDSDDESEQQSAKSQTDTDAKTTA